MPNASPEWPTGEQVQSYLVDYAAHFGVDRCGWAPRSAPCAQQRRLALGRSHSADGSSVETVDRLVVANGIFSEPFVPALRRSRGFRRRPAGG